MDGQDRLLLIISHPDDEAMFFSPFLKSVYGKDAASQVWVLCLSTGNDQGLGDKRRLELIKSCALYGISRTHVRVIDHVDLQDGMNVDWPLPIISDIVVDMAREVRPSLIITFDDYGVSGHPNHIATYKGVVSAIPRLTLACPSLRVLALESTNVVRKFMGIFDVATSYIMPSDLYCTLFDPTVPFAAMMEHRTQLVWFRYLFIVLSRFSYVNTFKLVTA
jgi:N-acetylglucosaminylphosphatidylinositol deacetylase